MKEYSYTSTPPMGCTACTEPQCLYKGDLYHPFLLLQIRDYPHTCNQALPYPYLSAEYGH